MVNKKTASGGPFPVQDVTRSTKYPGGGVSGGPKKLNNAKLNGQVDQNVFGYYDVKDSDVTAGNAPKQGVNDTSKGPGSYGVTKKMNAGQSFNTLDSNKDVKGGM